MVDFIKIMHLQPHLPKHILHTLNAPIQVQPNTAEIINVHKGLKYKNLEFDVFENSVQMKGSIHKYYNNGAHNYNDYTINDIIKTIIELCNLFNICPYSSALNNVEYGVNVECSFNVDNFLNKILLHKNKHHIRKRDVSTNLIEFIHSDYIFKIYNKGKQYRHEIGTNKQILRIEIKVVKMRYLQANNIPIQYLADLTNIDLLNQLQPLLLHEFNKIVLLEDIINTKNLKPKEIEFYKIASQPTYWQTLYNQYANETNKTKYNSLRQQYKRRLARYNEIQTQCSTEQYKFKICQLINEKIQQLSTTNTETEKLIAQLKNVQNTPTIEPKIVANSQGGKNEKCTKYTTCIYSVNVTKCIITGLDISSQKIGSKFLSNISILQLYFNDNEQYNQLRKKYLPVVKEKYKNDINKICYLIAHNIRNTETNPRNNSANKIKSKINK